MNIRTIIKDIIEEATFNLPGKGYWDRQDKLMQFGGSLYTVDRYEIIKQMWNDGKPKRDGSDTTNQNLIKQYVFKRGNISPAQLKFFNNLMRDTGDMSHNLSFDEQQRRAVASVRGRRWY